VELTVAMKAKDCLVIRTSSGISFNFHGQRAIINALENIHCDHPWEFYESNHTREIRIHINDSEWEQLNRRYWQ
jgi:hypothetical protein